MDNTIVYSAATDPKCSNIDESTKEYLYFRRELQEQLQTMNDNASSLIRRGAHGICNRVKNLLSGMNISESTKESYSMEQLPTHESEGQDEEEYEDSEDNEDSVQILSKMENMDISHKDENDEKKIKQLTPFFTVVNDDSGDVKYKEMCRDTPDRRKNFSLVALKKKIEKRNDFLNKFGKTYIITNLS